MKIQSNKRLIQYCDFISVLSLFAAIAYGLSQILPLCYEMGKDDSDTFIWKALVQAIECYAIFFIGLLAYFMASNVKKERSSAALISASYRLSVSLPCFQEY